MTNVLFDPMHQGSPVTVSPPSAEAARGATHTPATTTANIVAKRHKNVLRTLKSLPYGSWLR